MKGTAVAHIFSVERVSDHVYYTDGSVTDNKVSAAFVTTGYAKGCRLQDGCSILQAELVAIREALTHSERQGLGRTVVHSDSLAAIQSLRGNPKDNIGLANDILDIASRLPEAPLVNWVPSHVGIWVTKRPIVRRRGLSDSDPRLTCLPAAVSEKGESVEPRSISGKPLPRTTLRRHPSSSGTPDSTTPGEPGQHYTRLTEDSRRTSTACDSTADTDSTSPPGLTAATATKPPRAEPSTTSWTAPARCSSGPAYYYATSSRKPAI